MYENHVTHCVATKIIFILCHFTILYRVYLNFLILYSRRYQIYFIFLFIKFIERI